MKLLPALAALLFCSSAFAASAPDALVVTGPNLEQKTIDGLLVTPTGGIQMTLRNALAFGGNLSSPPPIGNVTPSTGAFTTLTANGFGTIAGTFPTNTIVSSGFNSFGGATNRNQSANRTWVGVQALGLMTYFDVTSQTNSWSSAGGIGLAGAARSSDGNAATAAIGVGGFGLNDNTGTTQGAWAGYLTTIRNPGVSGPTEGLEIDVANLGTAAPSNSYLAGTASGGLTAGIWLASGGEAAAAGMTVNPATAALTIVKNGATFLKGIVIGSNALEGDTGTTGTATALEMGKGQQIDWTFDGSGQTGFVIRSDATTTGMGIISTNAGINFTTNAGVTETFIGPTGNMTVGSGVGGPTFAIDGAAGNSRSLAFRSGGVSRWVIYANSNAETGSNVGSDLAFGAYTDAGGYNKTPMTIERATGNTHIDGTLIMGGTVRLQTFTVATLPTCNAGLLGGLSYVTDATGPTYNATLTGGGSKGIPVACDGAVWTAH